MNTTTTTLLSQAQIHAIQHISHTENVHLALIAIILLSIAFILHIFIGHKE